VALLYDVIDALYEKDRRRRRRRIFFVAGLVLMLGLTAVFWRQGRQVVAAVASEVGVRRVELFAEEIRSAATESGVDPYLLAGIMYSESRGQVDARSTVGALGLMQLALSAASDSAGRLGMPAPTEEELLSDARLNIRLGARHVAWLIDHQGDMDLEQLLICYNAGRTKFFRWCDGAGSYSAWRAGELDRMNRGEKNTGTLSYAVNTLAMRDHFARRGVIDSGSQLLLEFDGQ
jgi:soluble lytic murein transglycosylase-like protein